MAESKNSASLCRCMFGQVRPSPTVPEASKIGQRVLYALHGLPEVGSDTLVMESVARNMLKGCLESWAFGKSRCSSEINQQEPDKDT